MVKESEIKSRIADLFSGIEFCAEPEGLYDPLRYMISIGGKRIRPKLCLLAYSLFKDGIGPEIEQPSVALEVFHTFTLIHDDIMDRSPLRRGQDTVWKKWSEDTAILSGDVMLIDAYRRMLSCPQEALRLFTRTAAEVCEGQQYDMQFEKHSRVTMAQYEKMIGLKTAVLVACSAKMGAIIAGASKEDCEALYDYGYQLGMAFQIADDYLDVYGDQKVFGKPIGGDIVNGKKSWMILKALEKADAKTGEEILAAMNLPCATPEGKRKKIAAVKKFYNDLGVDIDALKEIERFTLKAMEAVGDFSAESKDALGTFARELVGRAK